MIQDNIIHLAIMALEGAAELEKKGDKKGAYKNVECTISYLETYIETYMAEQDLKPVTVEDIKKAMQE